GAGGGAGRGPGRHLQSGESGLAAASPMTRARISTPADRPGTADGLLRRHAGARVETDHLAVEHLVLDDRVDQVGELFRRAQTLPETPDLSEVLCALV